MCNISVYTCSVKMCIHTNYLIKTVCVIKIKVLYKMNLGKYKTKLNHPTNIVIPLWDMILH